MTTASSNEKTHKQDDVGGGTKHQGGVWGYPLFPDCFTCQKRLQKTGQQYIDLMRSGFEKGAALHELKLRMCCRRILGLNLDLSDEHIAFTNYARGAMLEDHSLVHVRGSTSIGNSTTNTTVPSVSSL